MALSKYNRSRYFNTYEVNNKSELDLLSFKWLRFNDFIAKSGKNALSYKIENQYENRPDLISDRFYGNTEYWWIIANINFIIKPYSEFTAGKVIAIPRLIDIESYYSEILNRQRKGSRVVLPRRTV